MAFISQAGMEICWLQSLSAFMLFAFFNHRLSLLFTLSIYVSGVTANYVCYHRRLLRFQVVLVKALIFSTAFLAATKVFFLNFGAHHGPRTILTLFSFQQPVAGWGLTATLLLAAGITWRRSTIHTLNPLSSENVYNRLDLGMGIFFALLILKLMLFGKFGLTFAYPDLKTLYLPFFVFGLLTLALMFSAEGNDRRYVMRFQKLGVALSFAAVIIAGGAGLVFLFHGQMRASAEMMSGILKKAGPPLETAVVWLMRLGWSSNRHPQTPPVKGSDNVNVHVDMVRGSMENGWIWEVLKWGGTALFLLAVVFFSYILLRWLFRFLLSETDPRHSVRHRGFHVGGWLKRLLALFRRIFGSRTTKGIPSAKDLFRSLVSWGGRSGIPHRATDTPKEYGTRLSMAFPELSAEIETVIHLFYRETYGELRLDGQQMAAGRSAKKRMAHPTFWKDRLKSWMLSPENSPGKKRRRFES